MWTHYAKPGRCGEADDLSGVETTLVTQANMIDMIFNQLVRKSALCDYQNETQAHLSPALKARCRATLEEALTEIRHPRPVAFVKQVNIANGPQQVNNQTGNNAAPPGPRARREWRSDERAINGRSWDDNEPWHSGSDRAKQYAARDRGKKPRATD